MYYAESGNNLADDASRDLDSKNKKAIKRLFDGSSFLWNREQCWENDMRSNALSEQDPELRKVIKVSVTQIENEPLSKLQEKRSSCAKLKRLVAKKM